MNPKHIHQFFFFFFCQTTHWHSGSLKHAYETAVSNAEVWLSSQKFYTVCEKKTRSFSSVIRNMMTSVWQSLKKHSVEDGLRRWFMEWGQLGRINTLDLFLPISHFPAPWATLRVGHSTKHLGDKAGGRHSSSAIGKRSFSPMPIWQSSRTLLVGTEDLRELP